MNKAWNTFCKGAKWFFKSWLWLIPLLFIIDIVSKLGLERILLTKPGHAITVIPGFFRIALLYNTGAAWGMFAGKDWLLVSISLIASAVMIYFLIAKFKKLTLCQRLSLCLMIPGALGNLIDRAFYKNGVIDFLEFTFGSYHFPTFNFADSCLVVGVILLMISEIIVDLKETKEKEKAKEKSNNIDSKKLTEELKENSAEDDASTSDESTEEHDENSKE